MQKWVKKANCDTIMMETTATQEYDDHYGSMINKFFFYFSAWFQQRDSAHFACLIYILLWKAREGKEPKSPFTDSALKNKFL